MSDPRLLATQRLWAAVGDLERRLEVLEASLTALCARLSDAVGAEAVMVPPDAGGAPSESQEVFHA